MKNIIKMLGTILMLSILLPDKSIQAQDIEAKLKTDYNNSGFVVKDSSGVPLFSIMSNGNTSVGSYNTNYLFKAQKQFTGTDNLMGRDILLHAEASDGGDGGSIYLHGASSHGTISYGDGANIKIGGNTTNPGTGGSIELITGNGEMYGGDILIKTGTSSSSSYRSGDINILTGTYWRTTSILEGGDFNVACGIGMLNGGNIKLDGGFSDDGVGGFVMFTAGSSETGPGGNAEITAGDGRLEAGDVHITAGNVSEDAHAGDIHLKPGTSPQSDNNGNVIVYGNLIQTGNSFQIADSRMKENIAPLTNSLGKLNRLNPVQFDWRSSEFMNKQFDRKKQIGLSAIEVETYYPELVNTNQDGLKSVDYTKLSVILIQAIKEQQKEIDELKEMIVQIRN